MGCSGPPTPIAPSHPLVPTRLKAELQVVLADHQGHHGEEEEEEGEGEADGALAPLLRAEIMAHHHEENLTAGVGGSSRKAGAMGPPQSQRDPIQSQWSP